MKSGDIIVVVLQNPREQIWGLLRSLNAAGVIIRGINTRNFEEWTRQTASKESDELGPETSFFPSHRIERISLDVPVGSVPSMASRFTEITGLDPLDILDKQLD